MIPSVLLSPTVEMKRKMVERSFYYEIQLEGMLNPKWLCWFDGFSLCIEGDQTIISGWIADQAGLYGMLARIRDLGIPLVSVNRVIDCK